MRIMGLDFGSKTVGVAISDELLLTAQGIEIIRRKDENKLRQTLARIEELKRYFSRTKQRKRPFSEKNLAKHLQIQKKAVPLHCVFHSIRFKVNKGWSKALLLFLCPYVFSFIILYYLCSR